MVGVAALLVGATGSASLIVAAVLQALLQSVIGVPWSMVLAYYAYTGVGHAVILMQDVVTERGGCAAMTRADWSILTVSAAGASLTGMFMYPLAILHEAREWRWEAMRRFDKRHGRRIMLPILLIVMRIVRVNVGYDWLKFLEWIKKDQLRMGSFRRDWLVSRRINDTRWLAKGDKRF
jgi:MFS family permease